MVVKPDWLRVKAPQWERVGNVKGILHDLGLNTVCEEASCPNIGECFSVGTATFLIMGPACTRACPYCDIDFAKAPRQLDPLEPVHLAEAVRRMQLKHVVITSVNRDDLPDGGVSQFVRCIEETRKASPDTTIEVLIPDLCGKIGLSWFEIEGPVCDRRMRPGSMARQLRGSLRGSSQGKMDGRKRSAREDRTGSTSLECAEERSSPASIPTPQGMMTVATKDPHKDSARLLRSFMERAYRRPVEESEFQRCLSFATQAIDDKFCLQDAMRLAYKAALCSPDFIYFVEEPGKLDDYSIASRLSYMLWRSLPDESLIASAKAGKLQSDEGILEQFDRMLEDPKSDRFVSDFIGQWLNLRAVNDTSPDRDLYPEYFCDTHVVISSVEETEATFEKMLKENLPMSTVVDSDFVMVNERLAEVYELDGVRGGEIREVPLPEDSPRGGLLTQSSVMKVTANGLATSPVLRGVWVLDRILGTTRPVIHPRVPVPSIRIHAVPPPCANSSPSTAPRSPAPPATSISIHPASPLRASMSWVRGVKNIERRVKDGPTANDTSKAWTSIPPGSPWRATPSKTSLNSVNTSSARKTRSPATLRSA